MEPKRVLHVVPNMHRAGLETFIMNVYRNIDRTKIQFDFLVHYTDRFDYDDEIESLGGKIYRLSIRNDNNVKKYLSDLKQFFYEHKEFNVVHGHMESFGFLYSRAAKKAGIKTIIAHSHNASIEPTFKGFLKSIMNKPWKRYANVFFACSEKAGKYMFGNKVNYTVVNNGIECEKFDFNEIIRNCYRKDLGLLGKTVIGHIGRFDTQKNHAFLIDIFNEYLKINNNSILLLIGEGELYPDIVNKVKKLGIFDKVLFLGVRSDISNLYQAMDIFVLPSLFEGLPVVGVEAQTSGLPIVVSSEVTDELRITDLVFKISLSSKTMIWAKQIDIILRNSKNRVGMVEKMKKSGYDIKEISKSLCSFYESRMKSQ